MAKKKTMIGQAMTENGLLTPEEEYSKLKHLHEIEKDSPEYQDLMNDLIVHNMRLVTKIAREMVSNEMDLDDAVQEGTIGLMRAVEKYDPNKLKEDGTPLRLSTYAIWWIRQSIDRYLNNTTRSVRTPVHIISEYNKYRRVATELAQKYHRDPTFEEIAMEFPDDYDKGVPLNIRDKITEFNKEQEEGVQHTSSQVKEYERMKKKALKLRADYIKNTFEQMAPIMSVDKNIGVEGDPFTLKDMIPDPSETPEESALAKGQFRALMDLMDEVLTVREKHILCCRFGLVTGRGSTLQELGDQYHLSRERIRQIQKQARHKLICAVRAHPEKLAALGLDFMPNLGSEDRYGTSSGGLYDYKNRY